MKLLDDWTWEDSWGAVVMIVVGLVLALFAALICHDHSIRGYYLESTSGGVNCIKQSIDWDADAPAFCTDDVDKLLRVLREAQDSLRRGK